MTEKPKDRRTKRLKRLTRGITLSPAAQFRVDEQRSNYDALMTTRRTGTGR